MLMETKMVSHRCLGALIISPTTELVSTVHHLPYIYLKFCTIWFTVCRMLCIAWYTTKNSTSCYSIVGRTIIP